MTKTQVIETVGAPSGSSTINGDLVYSYAHFDPGVFLSSSYEAYQIVFDKKGRVKKILHQDGGTWSHKERQLK